MTSPHPHLQKLSICISYYNTTCNIKNNAIPFCLPVWLGLTFLTTIFQYLTINLATVVTIHWSNLRPILWICATTYSIYVLCLCGPYLLACETAWTTINLLLVLPSAKTSFTSTCCQYFLKSEELRQAFQLLPFLLGAEMKYTVNKVMRRVIDATFLGGYIFTNIVQWK